MVVTKKLLAIQRGTGESTVGSRPSAVFHAAVVNGSGISDTGLASRIGIGLERVGDLDEERPEVEQQPEEQHEVAEDQRPTATRGADGAHVTFLSRPMNRSRPASVMMIMNSTKAIAAPWPNSPSPKLFV